MENLIKRINRREREYVKQVLDDQFRISTTYRMAKRLEETFSKKFGIDYSIAFANGTATLHTALEAAGIGIGDEVIVPPLTMASTSMAVLQANAVPVFADVDSETFNISPRSVEKIITPRTKAIIPVALYGLAPDMDPIMDIAERDNLYVIEDAAQCFLGKYKGKLVGTIGHIGSFSFQSTKHMTCGEGGMITTNDRELAIKVRRCCSLGYAATGAQKGKITKEDIQDPDYDRHETLGWNYRMSDICAAVALGQLERLDLLVERRKNIAAMYKEAIGNCNWLTAQKVPGDCEPAYWSYVVKLEHPNITWYDFRNKYIELGGDGIYAAWKLTYFEPFFQNSSFLGREKIIGQSIYQAYKKGLCPNAERLQPRLLQFKTNYWDLDVAVRKMEALQKTIQYFKGKRQ